MIHAVPTTLLQRLCGVLVCLCLVLQPLALRLHLAIAEHTHGTDQALVAHDHGDGTHYHPHPHDAPDADEEGEDGRDHPPHPARDHVEQAKVKQPVPPSAPQPFALPSGLLPPLELQEQGALDVPRARVPEQPPPRGPTRSRAPPSVA